MFVCYDCIGDLYYKHFIKNNGESKRKCRYCKKTRRSIELELLANEVDEQYRENYEPKELGYGDTPSFFISEMLDLDNEAISDDLVEILSAREERDVSKGADALYDSDSFYGAKDNDYFGNFDYRRDEWYYFCDKIKHKIRFFNNDLINYLNSTFKDLKNFKYANKLPIRSIEPNDLESSFFRARLVRDVDEERIIQSNPSTELEPPPPHKAKAGRMNPAGISVFYGAFKPETCIAEIKCSVGDKVIIGRFELVKPIKVIDLSILSEIEEPCYTDAIDFDELYGLFHFLKGFSYEVSKPV